MEASQMMTVRTHLSASSIHGVGVFTKQKIFVGEVVWKHNPVVDQRFTSADLQLLSDVQKEWVLDKSYLQNGIYHLDGDDCRYMNHSLTPNISCDDFGNMYANKDIEVGEELTCNYTEFCDDMTVYAI